MPEGDTLHRTASGLRPHLLGRAVTAARAVTPGPQIQRIVGSTITGVEAMGKNLLIRFDNGLELRTHLRMTGSWHRYATGERWKRPASRARVVLETPNAVAVCFDCPTVELFETRAERVHPTLARLGPDLLAADFDHAEAIRRLRLPERREMTISEALLDQRALAGIGNIWRNETLFAERVDPLVRVADVDDETLDRLVATARRLLNLSVGQAPGRAPMAVYGRSGRACRRCGTTIRSAPLPAELPRTTYWCPRCQEEIAMTLRTTIDVACDPTGDGWTCRVRLADERGSGEHRVGVRREDLERFAPGTTDPGDLVRRSFEFLLEREPRRAILSTFDLPVIGRYFPDYERAITG